MIFTYNTGQKKQEKVSKCYIVLINRVQSVSAAEEAVNALAWVHSLAGLESPTTKPNVQSTLQGLKRIWCKSVQKRKPIPAQILSDMAKDTLANSTSANLTLSLLSFTSFLRFDEAIHLRACKIKVTADIAKIFLPHSKTDQFRQGNEVLIARTHEDTWTCPVRMLEHYMSRAGITADNEGCIFRGITKTTDGERLRPEGALCVILKCKSSFIRS